MSLNKNPLVQESMNAMSFPKQTIDYCDDWTFCTSCNPWAWVAPGRSNMFGRCFRVIITLSLYAKGFFLGTHAPETHLSQYPQLSEGCHRENPGFNEQMIRGGRIWPPSGFPTKGTGIQAPEGPLGRLRGVSLASHVQEQG